MKVPARPIELTMRIICCSMIISTTIASHSEDPFDYLPLSRTPAPIEYLTPTVAPTGLTYDSFLGGRLLEKVGCLDLSKRKKYVFHTTALPPGHYGVRLLLFPQFPVASSQQVILDKLFVEVVVKRRMHTLFRHCSDNYLIVIPLDSPYLGRIIVANREPWNVEGRPITDSEVREINRVKTHYTANGIVVYNPTYFSNVPFPGENYSFIAKGEGPYTVIVLVREPSAEAKDIRVEAWLIGD